MRSGAQTLALLAAPLTCILIRGLEEEPKSQTELRRAAGSPAQTTLRAHLKRLLEAGAIEKRRRNRFPGVLDFELTRAGRDLLFVTDVLERWLARAPSGPLSLGSSATKAAVKALAEGWSTTMLRALATGPQSLTELATVISSLSYPSLERRLAVMRLTDQVEVYPGLDSRGTPYRVTRWTREAVAPLIAAARWERAHMAAATTPIAALDVEAGFLLSVPLVQRVENHSGSCRLTAELKEGRKRRPAGVTVVAENGVIELCDTQAVERPDAWALGPAMAWIDATIDDDATGLELGGNCSFARALVSGLHQVLFRPAHPVQGKPTVPR